MQWAESGDGSAPASGARWVVRCADKCVALTPGEWPSRHRLKQYSHSFIRAFKSPAHNTNSAAPVTSDNDNLINYGSPLLKPEQFQGCLDIS